MAWILPNIHGVTEAMGGAAEFYCVTTFSSTASLAPIQSRAQFILTSSLF